jgi:hypothetical protein
VQFAFEAFRRRKIPYPKEFRSRKIRLDSEGIWYRCVVNEDLFADVAAPSALFRQAQLFVVDEVEFVGFASETFFDPDGTHSGGVKFGGGASATKLTSLTKRRFRQESLAVKTAAGGGGGFGSGAFSMPMEGSGSVGASGALGSVAEGASMPRFLRLRGVAAVRTLTMWGWLGSGRSLGLWSIPVRSRPRRSFSVANGGLRSFPERWKAAAIVDSHDYMG